MLKHSLDSQSQDEIKMCCVTIWVMIEKWHHQVNHFPGTFEIGRKDKLWKNLYRCQVKFSKKVCKLVLYKWEAECGLSVGWVWA